MATSNFALDSRIVALFFALFVCLVAICLIPDNRFFIYCFTDKTFISIATLLVFCLFVIFSLWRYTRRSKNKQPSGASLQKNKNECFFSIGAISNEKAKHRIECMENIALEKRKNFGNRSHVTETDHFAPKEVISTNSITLPKKANNASNESYALKADQEILQAINNGEMSVYQLENSLGDMLRAVDIRRQYFASKTCNNRSVGALPYKNYDYSLVANACCENVLGFVPVPLGYAGPITVDGQQFFVPMATTEGALIASTNRGCRAISASEGVQTRIIDDFMTRAPIIEFDSLGECYKFKHWLEIKDNLRMIKQKFDGTSRYLSLKKIESTLADRLIFLRFYASTGDAMGMNMVSKATESALNWLKDKYFSHTSMRIVSLSGNFCADKKSAAINWILGRGKHVIAEAIIPAQVVSKVLKTSVPSMVHLHISKNLVGSALAGACGGFNAHCANIVTAIFLACGQDVAQTVSSSQCLTMLSEMPNGDLRISCTMPCLEVGTVGGGTILPAQRACLQILGCAGGHPTEPGKNARRLASTICATVVAGELSLLAALTSNDLVKSHMKHNRSALYLSSGCSPKREKSGSDRLKSDSSDYCSSNLRKLADKAASTASLLQPTCSNVLT